MGTRTVWLCLAWGIACSPTPANTDKLNELKLHDTSTNKNLTSADAADIPDGAGPSGVDNVARHNGWSEGGLDAATMSEAGSDRLSAAEAGPDPANGHDADAARDAAVDAMQPETFDARSSTDAELTWSDAAADAAPDAEACAIPDIPGSECELRTSCGCESGLVCRVADQHTGQTLCFTPGETQTYAPCGFDQDCTAGQVCEAGLCRPQCENPGHFCEDGSSCATFSEGGRNVCVGHCNVLTRSPAVWSSAERWVKAMQGQQELGLRDEYWTAPYSDCGEGAYCHPGVGPDEASSPRPLYPHCMPAKGYEVDNSYCTDNEDCVSGLACGVYPGESQGRCIRLGFVEEDCQQTGHGVQRGTNIDGTVFISPDGRNTLGLCTKSLR